MCRSALDNLVSAESARNYLIAAAERAGILDRVVNQSSMPPAQAAA